MKLCRRLAVFAVVALIGPAVAQAAPIVVCNTGQGALCAGVLPDGSIDSNYTIVAGPVGFTGATKVVKNDGYPIPPWVANDANSKWIGPGTADDNSDGPDGSYTYRTTFDLTGFIPATALLAGFWSTDNETTDILINGSSTGNTSPFGSYLVLKAFSIGSGFVSGINTLDFVINNAPCGGCANPTGLRVDDIVGTAGLADGDGPIAPVPEPATLGLLGLGLLGARARRQRRAD